MPRFLIGDAPLPSVPTALLDKPDLAAVAAPIIAGYTAEAPLQKREADLLHTLVAARLCQSAIMSAYSFSQDPTNTYLLVTALPGWKALTKWMAMTPVEMGEVNGAAALIAA